MEASGSKLGVAVGSEPGSVEGEFVASGSELAAAVGSAEGTKVGSSVGSIVGSAVGVVVGSGVGSMVGSAVGSKVGAAVGSDVGGAVVVSAGGRVGIIVGCNPGVSTADGDAEAGSGKILNVTAGILEVWFTAPLFFTKYCLGLLEEAIIPVLLFFRFAILILYPENISWFSFVVPSSFSIIKSDPVSLVLYLKSKMALTDL